MNSQWSAKLRRFDIREERLRVAIVLGAVAVLNLVLYLALVLPRMHQQAVARQGEASAAQNLSEISRRVTLMQELDERFETELAKVETFYNQVLGKKESRMVQIQREVRSIAVSFGMDPETINYQSEFLDKVGLIRFQINVPLVGDYKNLRQFIHRIEESETFLIVDGVGLGGSRSGGALLDLNIQLSTYFLPPQVERLEQVADADRGRN